MEVMGTPERLFIMFAMFGVSFAVGQEIAGINSFTFSGPLVDYYQLQVPNSTSEVPRLNRRDFSCFGDFASDYSLYIQNLGRNNVTGRCLYKNPVQLLKPPFSSLVSSFSTMFAVRIYRDTTATCPGFDISPSLAFIITGDKTTEAEAGGHFGWPNSTNNGQKSGHNFAVEFKGVYRLDACTDGMQVGISVNGLIIKQTVIRSVGAQSLYEDDGNTSYFYRFKAWIEYDGRTQILDIAIAPSFEYMKPKPLFSIKVNLTEVMQKNMFVGLWGSISQSKSCNVAQYGLSGYPTNSEFIDLWTFNANGPAPEIRKNSDGTFFTSYYVRLEEEEKKKKKSRRTFVVSISVSAGVVFIFACVIYILYRRTSRLNALAKKYQLEELEQLAIGPRSFRYKVLSAATKGFHSTHLLGTGGFGSVFKGKVISLPGAQSPTYVAIKRISATSHQGAREFVAEVKIIGQVQHRNLVRLLGWCHERGELLLVYDYMPNGSLDQHLFKNYKDDSVSSSASGGQNVLSWARRLKIVSGVATALAYLHEEWEQRVIHRDVKSSNVMLDTNFNARLGDFGLARLSDHALAPPSTVVLAGTRGYLAPELGHTLKATEKTDVYSFGVLVLEVATGRRPLLPLDDRRTPNEVLLVDWVWGLYNDGKILEVADHRLEGAFDRGEMITLLKIGLLCCHPDPDERPTMRQVMNIWKGASVFPPLPRSKPVPVFVPLDSSILSFDRIVESDADSILRMPTEGYPQSTPDELDYVEARDRFSGLGGSVRSRPWKSTPLPM